jgi:hypothetical protein
VTIVSGELAPAQAPAATLAAAPSAPPEAALEWSVDPWRTNPRAATAGLVATLALAVLALRLAGSWVTGVLLAIACLLVLNPAFAPTRFRVDAEGVARRRGLAWERRAWRDLRRAAVVSGGVLVTPFAQASFRDSFRGLVLELPPTLPGREALREELSRRLALHGIPLGVPA